LFQLETGTSAMEFLEGGIGSRGSSCNIIIHSFRNI
jgi:hypothetical protein